MASEKASLLHGKQVVLMPVSGQRASKLMQYGCLSVDLPLQPDEDGFDKYGPLTQKQIAHYANDPWWLNLRRGLMISFWASMALMVLAAVLIAIVEHEHVCVAGKSLTAPTAAPPMPLAIIFPMNASASASTLANLEALRADVNSNDVLAVVSQESPAVSSGSVDGGGGTHRRAGVLEWLQHI